jgi:hypothetical protein
MPIRRQEAKNICEFVDTLTPGTRVIWVADGTAGTVQPDRSVLWDCGRHMTRNELKSQHAILVHSQEERRQLHAALEARLKCLKSHCKLVHWDDDGYDGERPERLCPLAVLSVPPRTASAAAASKAVPEPAKPVRAPAARRASSAA